MPRTFGREVRPPRARSHRRPIRRVVIAIPSGLTLANLFFGVFAIIAASRGQFSTAGLYIVIGGIADALDGRVARATNTGSDFGSELDSLVDVISFGLAPAMIMYFAVLNREGWDWIWSFVFVACAASRLARFNVEQAGRAKKYFHGLPSPAAGLTLATYYWFSQTSLYSETNMAHLPWHVMLRFVMGALSALMISDVSYPAFPPVGYKTVREILGTAVVIITIASVFIIPKQFFFPACLAYVLYGLVKTTILGLIGRRAIADSPVIDEIISVSVPDVAPEMMTMASPRLAVTADTPLSPSPQRRRRRRRPPRGNRPDGNRSDGDRSDRPERFDRPDRSKGDSDSPPPKSPPPPPAGE